MSSTRGVARGWQWYAGEKKNLGILFLLAEALSRLRQEYATEGKTSTFEALKVFLDPNNSSTDLRVRTVLRSEYKTTGSRQQAAKPAATGEA